MSPQPRTSETISLKRFVLRNYLSLLCFTTVFMAVFAIAMGRFVLEDAISNQTESTYKIMQLHRAELLDEVALNDTLAINEHLKLLRDELSADSVRLEFSGSRLKAEAIEEDPNWSQKLVEVIASILDIEDLVIQISNDFGSYPVEIKVSRKKSLVTKEILPAIMYSFVNSLGIIFLLACSFFVFFRRFRHHIIVPLEDIARQLSSPDDPVRMHSRRIALSEIHSVSEALKEFRRLSHIKVFTRIARQVAHDIRSPLSALLAAEKEIRALPSDTQYMLSTAIGRIQRIANSLLEQTSDSSVVQSLGQDTQLISSEIKSPQLISWLLKTIVQEKQLQYRNLKGIRISLSIEPNAKFLFSEVQAGEFNRVISNLVNNSVEAIRSSGQISITLTKAGSILQLKVSDTGVGIASDKLEKIGTYGLSFGKKGGNGIGLFHAKTTLRNWGGELKIISKPGDGTSVMLDLPISDTSRIIAKSLSLRKGGRIFILDDDENIHNILRGRLNKFSQSAQLSVIHCHNADEFACAWASANDAFYLIDFDLSKTGKNGFEIITHYSLQAQSFLMTSRFDDNSLLKKCLESNVRLLPKVFLGDLDIIVSPEAQLDAILIDDDQLIHMTWQISARANGKIIKGFLNALDFLESSVEYDKSTPIYVDFELSNSQNGLEIAKKIYSLGFRNINLATGHNIESSSENDFINTIIGKQPPW